MINYINIKNKEIEIIATKVDNNQLDLYDLEDSTIDELIGYYSKQICIKKQQINKLRKKVKGES